jgi:hypothetical protein
LLAGLVLAACGTATGAGKSSTTNPSNGGSDGRTSTTINAYPPSEYPPGTVVPAPDTSTTIPEDGGLPITQNSGTGQQILITPNGFWPNTLYANQKVAITWTNLSGRPQRVSFDHIPISSGVIPVGAQFVWKTHFGGSYTYSSASGFHALLILQLPQPIGIPATTTP